MEVATCELRKQHPRNRSFCQQTIALLWKNVILKWRMRTQSFQEWLSALILLCVLLMMTYAIYTSDLHEIPKASLGRLDDLSFNFTKLSIVYTPGTKMAREVMEKVESVSVMKGIRIELTEDEKAMEKAMEAAYANDEDLVGVVFQNDFSYQLRFPNTRVNSPDDTTSPIDTCYNHSADYCKSPRYWFQGFLSLQSSIDSALIERITNHSVWDEMKSISGIRMRSPSVSISDIATNSILFLIISICFSPFTYFLSQNVSREKRNLKELMKTMGLQDMAFWLSWSLVYAVYILIMSGALTPIIQLTYFSIISFPALCLLFFVYGISCIHFCFMLSSLLKKPKTTSFVGFLLTIFFGALGITTLIRTIPVALEWMLSLFCPFAFIAAFSKMSLYQKHGKELCLSTLMEEVYIYVLLFDSILYMLLALYFDKVVPDKYGVLYPPLFFLKKSYWFKSRGRSYTSDASTKEQSHGNIFSDNAEAVPPEFDGKEAIRLNNIKKTYKVKNMTTEALRGFSLNIYEGQITAVLGHSGAGKTTLLNILSGLSKPSDGSATIFKYNVFEKEDMEQIRTISAVCPQFNVQFEFLTVKENLKTFAKIKGIPTSDIEDEVQRLLTLLDMNVIQDTQANRLSGGQKRKLSLGITFLGEPQILFLDEPTAGLDPYSRQQVWSLLNERKAGRVILFTTQFMEEADILADRKAFISHGRLKCVGSSLFLKKRWGIGYHLRIHGNESCDPERTTSFVKRYIPACKLSGQRENELSYVLPLANVDTFPDLFCDMDRQTELGIINYGVTMTTLEDVFLKLEDNETFDEDYEGALHGEQVEEEKGASSPDEMEQDLLLLSDTGRATMRGTELWRQQVCAVARMHFLNLKRESKVWGSILFICTLMLLPFLTVMITFAFWKTMHHVELHPGLYFEPETISFTGTSGLLILNNTGESIDSFIHAVKSQNILVETITGYNVSGPLAHNGAIKVGLEDKKYRFTLMCHMEVTNCFPVLVNIISNALLQMLKSTAHIRVWNHVFLTFNDINMLIQFADIYIMGVFLLFPALPTHFAMNSYYKIKTHAQLRVSGLLPSAYWCGLALVDISVHWILLFLVFAPWFAIFVLMESANTAIIFFCMVPFLFGYGMSIVLFLYIISFIFQKKACASSFWSFIIVLATLLFLIMKAMVNRMNYLNHVMNFLIPLYSAVNFLITMTTAVHFHDPSNGDFLQYKNELIVSTSVPYIQSIAFIFLLWYLEKKYGRPVMRRDPVFRISPHRECSHQNPAETIEDEDKDVHNERSRAQSALMSANQEEKPVIIIHNLHKEYKNKVCCSCCKKTKEGKKVATRNVSFCVKKGEVLGLLGPNGAGKSTTINMITGDTDVTAGQVLIKGSDAAATEENAPGFLGYCPQENAVWPNLTVEEHLQIYAAVKGITKDAAGAAISRIVQALELQGHLKMTAKILAAGLTRKLCFALSMMGNPAVMLLDEPTTGMDPRGKRQVWKAIHTVLKDKDQGAILTTHHMEEAEAVCDRVAIMVCGQLRCLGSIQYLKSKFGKNYLLQIKVKGVEEGDLLNTEILKLFPQAARQERISTLLVYKIPMADALPLSKAFSKLEEAKRRFNLEEYSFSLNTLEQVFLELCKEQERDYVDRTLDTTFEWKRLQQDDV